MGKAVLRMEKLYIASYFSATLRIVGISVNVKEQYNTCGEHDLLWTYN